MPVNPGRLRERIEVLEGTIVNSLGGATTEWDTLGMRWAAVVQVAASGAAKYEMAGTSDVTHEITLRADPTLRLSLGRTLIQWRGVTLQPAAPPFAADHRGRFVTIPCKEVPPHGQESS